MIYTGTLTLPISDAVSARVEWEAEISPIARVMRDDPGEDREVEMWGVEITLIDETSDATIGLDKEAAKTLGLWDRSWEAAERAASETEIEE
ncbi:MAG: hypothetical protein ACK5XN_18865 [Bacteroidota bacterium]